MSPFPMKEETLTFEVTLQLEAKVSQTDDGRWCVEKLWDTKTMGGNYPIPLGVLPLPIRLAILEKINEPSC